MGRASTGHLPEHEVKALVSGFGVRVPRGAHVAVGGDVRAAASELTPPLVVKAYGPALLHKSDAGAVALGNASAEAAADAAAAMLARGVPAEGFLVEEQAAPGVEVIIGAVRDPAFGPVLLVGLGGVLTEVMNDAALRLLPVTEADVRDMLGELRGKALLAGYRGRPGVDVDALVKTVLAVADALDSPEFAGFAEFELNPVICSPDGVIAVDARLVPGSEEGTSHRAAAVPSQEGTHQTFTSAAHQKVTFDALFAPRAVAVVGASTRKPNFGNMFLGFYQKVFSGPIYAVHPTAESIDGVPCVKSLAEADVDYALVAVPASQCAEVVAQASGIPFVQVMSGGFGETGDSSAEDALLAAIPSGTRLLGPNCMGVYSPAGGQTFLGGVQGPPGSVSVVSQSGGLAGEVIKVGERRGLAYAKVATVGNSLDVTPADLLSYLGEDPSTSAIGLYLEDPRDGVALRAALAGCPKPVVALVGGRSAQGRQAAASHTGGMIGDGRVWTALSRQTGLALVTSQDDLVGVLDFFDQHAGRDAPGEGVLVIGPSGGASVLAADTFDAAGLTLDGFPAEARAALRALGLGAGTSLANPLEAPVGPRADPALVARAVTAILEHRAYPDVVAHVNAQSFFTFGDSVEPLLAYTRAIADLQRALPRTRITLVLRNGECAPAGVEDAVRAAAREGGVPLYRGMEAAASAISAATAALRRTAGPNTAQQPNGDH
ncbi:acetate--CoA ligase family protein [Actinocorallia sp. A-T 12471]|uniref:acetate--CoA ligase family protein n=1 Tax=Actinocorallia sp. A-T 12471 TaxID=3089813 RepID=UPI0029D1085F|nr:acetate--CoA ligase family protein [Actinocorallia sp. A-T 12471]MDX6743356.1 acetate--CoA ligase family protein [Actinocorallia sp. A-T 12471]